MVSPLYRAATAIEQLSGTQVWKQTQGGLENETKTNNEAR
jgi:hypothetical protein